jgi:hypothetical protein
MTARIDYHTEWIHNRTVDAENFLYRNCIVRRSYFTTSILNSEFSVKDAWGVGCVWECLLTSFFNGSWQGQHVGLSNCYYDGPFPIYPGDSYSAIQQTLFAGIGLGSGVPSLPTYPTLSGNVAVGAWPAGTPASNLTLADYAAFSALVLAKTTGDFRPASGVLTANLATRLDLYDGRLNLRADPDARGSWAVGFGPPSYPF